MRVEVSVGVPIEAPAATDIRRIIDWITAISEKRDLGLTPPADPRAAAIVTLLDVLSGEFSEYRDLIAGARDAARRNASQLAEIVSAATEQERLIRATAEAAAQAGAGSARMSSAAEALSGFTHAAAGAVTDAGANLATIDAALDELAKRLLEGDEPLGEMRRSTTGVGNFLITLARLSRHAQLLAVNASIEASHLAEGGSRFGIVAQEVRKLSTSTRESKAEVAQIVGELRESTDHVALATKDSKEATSSAASGIAGASKALARTGSEIKKFDQLVSDIVDLAGTQSMALDAVGTSVEQIALLSAESANASRGAARLDLDALLDRAGSSAGRWKVRTAAPASAPVCDDDAFAAWITAISAGADVAALSEIAERADVAPLVAAVGRLIERVNIEQRDLLANVIEVAVAVARNGYAWGSISASLSGVGHEIERVHATVGESVNGARTSDELAAGMHRLVESIRGQCDAALGLLEGALTRIAQITTSVRDINGFVDAMTQAATRADSIMALIETLSSETDLLSLNAAIEAAHAGELGLGFGVIAEEIRALARSTNDSTVSVTQLVANITATSGNLQASITAAAGSMEAVIATADGVRGAVGVLRSSFESAAQHALDVSSSAAEQSRALGGVLDNVNRSAQAMEKSSAGTSATSPIELTFLGARAHAIAARRPRGTIVEKVRELGESLCSRLETELETALGGGRVTTDQLFRLSYVPIAGADSGMLGRLFDVSRVPPSGFTPAKYATPWDGLIDAAMLDVLTAGWDEATAAGFAPVTILVCDLNGFAYAYPRQKIAAWADDPAIDEAGNRIKRIFEDDYALRIARHGLGPEVDLGQRCDYDTFRSAGCALERPAARSWGAFVSARDTSMVYNEVALAIYARGQRHSTLRVCYDANLI